MDFNFFQLSDFSYTSEIVQLLSNFYKIRIRPTRFRFFSAEWFFVYLRNCSAIKQFLLNKDSTHCRPKSIFGEVP